MPGASTSTGAPLTVKAKLIAVLRVVDRRAERHLIATGRQVLDLRRARRRIVERDAWRRGGERRR